MNSVLCLSALVLQLQASATNLEWAGKFWAESRVEERDEVAQEWQETQPEFELVFAALERGRVYSAEAPRGYLLRKRVDSAGVLHPYLILIPADYTPERKWPVRFQLHGGMGAPTWDPQKADWADGWNRASGSLMVFPAGWVDSMWWHASQVENFEAIQRELRATWNVDEDRVVAVGNSDGGAALYFLGMRTPDRYASYAGHVAPPDRLVRADFGPDGQMHIENLRAQRFHLGFGEQDRLVPIKYLRRYMELFEQVGADLDWYVLEDRGHNLNLSDELEGRFLAFIRESRRDPLPEELSWSTEDASRYARRSWIRIDELEGKLKRTDVDKSKLLPRWGTPIQLRGPTTPRVPFGTVEVKRDGNRVLVTSSHVLGFTLLLSPVEFDFAHPIQVVVNGTTVRDELAVASGETLLHWAARDDDRRRLFAAEWRIQTRKTEDVKDR